MEFISQKEFDAFINSLGNGTESAEISDFQNFFAQNDFSATTVVPQNQLGSFNDQKRDTASNLTYPVITGLPNIQGHTALANSFDFDMMQSQNTVPALPNMDSQSFIPPYPTPVGAAFNNELFGNSDVSSPDHSLSDSQYAYSSSGPSSPDSASVMSAAPSSPEVQYLAQKPASSFTPMFGVPANYGMDETYEIPSPQMNRKVTPVSVKQERTDLMEELEARVGWSSSETKDDKARKKPRDNSKESQQEKHKSAEKQRRSNMNDLLDRLKQLLPNSHTAEVQKMTKLTILSETVDYVVKLQELCKDLIQENKELKAQVPKSALGLVPPAGPVAIGRKVAPSNPQPQAQVEDAGTKKRKLGLVAGVQQYVMDGSRAIFLSVFFLMVVFSPYADHSHLGVSEGFDATAQTRAVLDSGHQTVIPPAVASGFVAFSSLTLLSTFLWNFIKWGFLVIAGFAFMVWGDRSVSTKSPNFALAKEEIEIAQVQVLSGQFSEVEEHCRKALELLDRVPPRSYFMALLLTVYQLWRHIMHRFVIGVYIEQFVASLKGTEKEYAELVADVSSILLKSWHKAPNIEWLYICLDALNTARVHTPHKVLALTAGSTFRIRGNTGMAFRMWEIYIDWGLRSMKENIVDSSLEQKHLLYSADAIKYVVQGELSQARANFKKALDLAALIENEKMRFFVSMKTLGMVGVVLRLEQRWKESMQLYKLLITQAEARQHKAGIYWGTLGVCSSLIRQKEIEKAKYVYKYFMDTYEKYMSCGEKTSIHVIKLELLMAEGKYLKALEQADQTLKVIKDNRNDMMVHSLPTYLDFGGAVLDMWEESLTETSSLRAHSSKLARMSHEICTLIYKTASANPVIQPRALIFKGQYNFILKNYPKAKYFWTSAVETARKIGLKADEKTASEKLSTHAQLEIGEECNHCPHKAIEKLVSTLTQQ